MVTGYKMLGRVIALLVLLQAGSIAYVSFAKGQADGAKAIHEATGMYLIPVLAVAMLVLALLIKSPAATKFAGALVALVILQIGLAEMGGKVHLLGALHGVVALVIFALAAMGPVVLDRAKPAAAA